jgi:hypothetical protein
VCGKDKLVGNNDAIFNPPTEDPPLSCGSLQSAGINGAITEEECTALPSYINEICECKEGILTPSPLSPPPVPLPPVSPAPITNAPVPPTKKPTRFRIPTKPPTKAPLKIPTKIPTKNPTRGRVPTRIPTRA